MRPAFGFGYSIGHHGEIVQGVYCLSPEEPIRRFLWTLPCPKYFSVAHATLNGRSGANVFPSIKSKVVKAVELALSSVELDGVDVVLHSNIECGKGLGSSTADIVAALRAISELSATKLDAREISRICVQAETASDPLAYDDEPVLFAQREGIVLARLRDALPDMHVWSVDMAPDQVFDTIRVPPAEYSSDEIEYFNQTFVRLTDQSAPLRLSEFGGIATRSMLINQRYFPKPRMEDLLQLARSFGAAGVQISHSGTVAGQNPLSFHSKVLKFFSY